MFHQPNAALGSNNHAFPCTSRSVRVCPAVERRQCFDLPPAAVEVTEHQLVERECGCGQRTKGTASDGVDAPVQYGPRIAAIIVYAGQFLPEKRTAQALAELFAIPLSSGRNCPASRYTMIAAIRGPY